MSFNTSILIEDGQLALDGLSPPAEYSSLTIWVIVLCAVFPFLATLSIIARFWTRITHKVPLRADDWSILPALVFTIATCCTGIWAAIDGEVGRQNAETTLPQLISWAKATYFLQIFQIAAIPLIKLSLLVFYNRIFNSPIFRMVSYAIGSYTLCWFIAFEFATIFQCSPISANWEFDNAFLSVCINAQLMLEWSAATNVFGDIFILLMPWPSLLRLHMPRGRKYGLLGLFFLGVFVCAASIAHLVYIILLGGPDGLKNSTHFMGYIVIWFSIEPSMGVICANLPTFGPILARQFPITRITTAIRQYLLTTLSRAPHGSRNTVVPPSASGGGAGGALVNGGGGHPFSKLVEQYPGGNRNGNTKTLALAEHIDVSDLDLDLEMQKVHFGRGRCREEGRITVTTDFEVENCGR